WLVLEEPDFSSARFVEGPDEARAAFERVHQAIAEMFERRGMDPAFGLRLPGLCAELGLERVAAETDAPIDRAGGGIARMMGMSARQLRDKYVGTGLASGADVDRYAGLAEEPACAAVYHGTVRASGRRPAAALLRTAL